MDEVFLSNISIFKGLGRVNLAMLIPELEKKNFKVDEIICTQGEPGDCFYILVKGNVSVYTFDNLNNEYKELAILYPGECFGEMALLTGETRSASVKAITSLEVYYLTKERFEKLINKHHTFAVHFIKVLSIRLANTNHIVADGHRTQIIPENDLQNEIEINNNQFLIDDKNAIERNILKSKSLDRNNIISITGIIMSVILFFCLQILHIDYNITILVMLLFAAAFFWSTKLLSFHVVSVALPLIAVICGVATSSDAFSGFSDAAWFLALGVFAVAAAITKTGLLYRVTLHMLKRFPHNYLGQALALSITGLILTPLIPSSNARIRLASPHVIDICKALGIRNLCTGSAGLAFCCLLGFGHLSFMFMNASSSNFLILGLLPKEMEESITWWYWLKLAAPIGILFFVMFYITIMFLYKPCEKVDVNIHLIDAQLRTLGKITTAEKISFFTIMITIFAFITQPIHHIDGAWIALSGFLILLVSSVLDDKSVGAEIDWINLISFGALLGFGKIINSYHLTQSVSEKLRNYVSYFIENTILFLLIVSISVTLIRFILPIIPAQLISMLTLLPIVTAFNIDPFIVGLVILISSNPWFLPSQSTLYDSLIHNTENIAFTRIQALTMASIHFIFTLFIVLLAATYWHFLGLIQ